MSDPIVLPPLGAPVDELRAVLLDLADRLRDVPWSLIGGQMVLLHALERGTVAPGQPGRRHHRQRPPRHGWAGTDVAELQALGFDCDGMAPGGTAHRYHRPSSDPERSVVIDVLAPEGVGPRADLTTTPPGRTLEVPGGSQALQRTEQVTVVAVGGRTGLVPRPSLLGAVVGKAAACSLPDDTSRHLRDLALLCPLIDDPFALVEQLDSKDRQRLRLAAALDDPDHQAWTLVPGELRAEGRAAWQLLNGLPAA